MHPTQLVMHWSVDRQHRFLPLHIINDSAADASGPLSHAQFQKMFFFNRSAVACLLRGTYCDAVHAFKIVFFLWWCVSAAFGMLELPWIYGPESCDDKVKCGCVNVMYVCMLLMIHCFVTCLAFCTQTIRFAFALCRWLLVSNWLSRNLCCIFCFFNPIFQCLNFI